MLNVFAPKYSLLFPFLENYTGNLTLATEQLKLLMQSVDPGHQNASILQINELRNKSNNLTYDIYSLLKRLFIVPFDREDMNELVTRIGEVLESIYSISRIIQISEPVETLPAYIEMAEITYLASIEIGSIVSHLSDISKNRSYIILGCETLGILEKRANEIYYSEILKMVVSRETADQLTKEKNSLELFMKCIRQTDMVTEIIRIILRKNS